MVICTHCIPHQNNDNDHNAHPTKKVGINYRLGVLGYVHFDQTGGGADLADGGGGAVANLGMQDQILALKWVKREIESFGGDPDNVTIWGESAGGWNVGALLGSPAASGLFHKAICQSGGGHSLTPRYAKMIADDVSRKLGFKGKKALTKGPPTVGSAPSQTDLEVRAVREYTKESKLWSKTARFLMTGVMKSEGASCFGAVPVRDGKLVQEDGVLAGVLYVPCTFVLFWMLMLIVLVLVVVFVVCV